MPRKTTLPALAVVLAAIAGPAAAECTLVATPVTQGLARPWGIGVLGDGRVLVTERGGRLSLIDLASGERLSVTGTPTVYAQGQGGLLDIAPAIDFADSARVYFTFSEIRGVGLAGTALATATLGGTESRPMLVDVEIIFRQSNPTASDYHFGSRVVPAPDGTLFVTIGDRGEAERAQDPEDHAGSVLHLNADGTPADGNPFLSGGGLPEIYSMGHRNPQGADIDPETGILWTVEHGARGGDEINRPEAGRNYGWPVISYGVHYTGETIGRGTAAEGYEQPVYFWDPSIAPSGLAVLRSPLFPAFDGDILVGALKDQRLVRLDMHGGMVLGETHYFIGEYGRIRDVAVAEDGAILFVTDEDTGALYRVVPEEGICRTP